MVVTVAPNTSVLPRTGIVTIAGRPVTVTQAGAVPTSATTSWKADAAADAPAWLTVSPGSGTGTGAVTLTAAPNMSVLPRSATVTIAGRPVTVTQDGARADLRRVVRDVDRGGERGHAQCGADQFD